MGVPAGSTVVVGWGLGVALLELAARHGEYEAALSLGLLERDAAMELVRAAARQALVPAMDQTRTGRRGHH